MSESGQEEEEIEEEGEEWEASVKSNEATSVDEMIRSTVKEMIKDATNSTERSTTYCQTLFAKLKDNKHNTIVGEMVKQMGGNNLFLVCSIYCVGQVPRIY